MGILGNMPISLLVHKEINPFLQIQHGDIVNVRLLTKPVNGIAKVLVNGKQVIAKVPIGFYGGSSLKMKASFPAKTSVLFLTPIDGGGVESVTGSNIFDKLGLPNNEAISALLSYFKYSELSLDSAKIKRAASLLKNIQNKKKYALAAVLAVMKGVKDEKSFFLKILPVISGDGKSPENLLEDSQKNSDFMPAELGKDGAGEKTLQDGGSELCVIANHIRTQGLQWITVPFKKTLNGMLCTGTLSLLLNIKAETCKFFSIRCKVSGVEWIFSFENGCCRFHAENKELKLDKQAELEAEKLLRTLLENYGCNNFSVLYTESEISNENSFDSLDVLI